MQDMSILQSSQMIVVLAVYVTLQMGEDIVVCNEPTVIIQSCNHNNMQKNIKNSQEEESNITVAIRIRPLSVKEQNSGDNDVIRVQDNLIIVLDPLDAQLEEKKILDVLHRSKEQRYAFDKIYRNHTNEHIYFQTTHPLIKTVLNGFNATVFAYGPTGTGKTYTMIGNQDTFGLNVLAIRDIFYYIDKDPDMKYDVIITYVEIYNEMIRDLLVPSSGYLQLRDDPEKGIVMAGVTEFKAESTEQVMNLLLIGNRRRTTEATNANLTSSRSHAVFQINISKTSKTKNIKMESVIGKLSLIDLAGSQRGTVTENRGLRLMEGAKINRSLLALANCINALGDKNKKGFFVPYRDSKLTRLLKDSLGGNCKTVMIVNVSPSSSQFEQTINTLKYANRAKNIKTKAITNKKLVALHISEYKNIINDLHREIEELKIRLSDNRGLQNRENFQNKDKLPRIESRHGKNSIGSDGICSYCGRIDEKEDIKSIKQQIFENFNERIQLRRAMMEIEEQNALNVLQIRKKSGQIALFKKNEGWEENNEISSQIREMSKVIHTLKLSTNKNMLKKEITNLQIMESMAATKKIRQDIMRKIRSKENRDTLEIIIKNHVLELQNIELEINLQIQERMIGDMRQIIMTQKSLLQQHGIESVQGEEQLPGTDEIEIELEQEDIAEESHQNQGEEEEIFDNFDQGDLESYKNFEFGKNKYNARENSAKKDLGEKKKKEKEEISFKKKEKEVKEKSIEKPVIASQMPPPINDFSLKGLKMNVKKKR